MSVVADPMHRINMANGSYKFAVEMSATYTTATAATPTSWPTRCSISCALPRNRTTSASPTRMAPGFTPPPERPTSRRATSAAATTAPPGIKLHLQGSVQAACRKLSGLPTREAVSLPRCAAWWGGTGRRSRAAVRRRRLRGHDRRQSLHRRRASAGRCVNGRQRANGGECRTGTQIVRSAHFCYG